MKNKEAIFKLIKYRRRLEEDSTIDAEPFDMAIEALKGQKIGHWIVTSKFDDCTYAKCDQCNITQLFYNNKALTNFCPNCGARMECEE